MRRFEVTTVRFDPDPRLTRDTFESRQDALAALIVPDDSEFFIRVSDTDGHVCRGEFELWCSGARAKARILEHREHDASHPDAATAGNIAVDFRDEDGAAFSLPFDETVPRALAIAAIRAWLADPKHPDMLNWT